MLTTTDTHIEKVSVHAIGSKANGEEMQLSNAELDIDQTLESMLARYFLSPFNATEFYSFTFSNNDHFLNPLFQYARQVFGDSTEFHLQSINIAKQLYEVSDHPQIKRGDLFVALIHNLEYEGRTVRGLGIFKSENRQPFLNLDSKQGEFLLNYQDGINIEKLDKGCIILNIEEDSGYRICIVDRSNKASEAQYWRDSFLMITPCKDEYHQTKDFLNIAKNYVTKQLVEDFVVNKTDQIDILNRSMEYFKTRDTFKKEEFEEEVFKDEQIINSFRKFDEDYRQSQDIEIEDSFEISAPAVKKQARVFKSVLKLDKNFHIYIHGDRNLIEQGVDTDGRKFYKIYFNEEN